MVLKLQIHKLTLFENMEGLVEARQRGGTMMAWVVFL